MFPANAHVIRLATEEDVRALWQLAQLDSQRPLGGSILIGEIGGTPAAAVSLTNGRTVSDPSQPTGLLTQSLRLRASALHAVAKTPSLRDRLRAGVRVSGQWRPAVKAA